MEREATPSGVVPWEKLKCPEPTIMSIQRLKDLLYSTCDLLYCRERIWHLWRPLILFTLIKALGTYDTSSRPWTLINRCYTCLSHLNNLNALDTHLHSNPHLHSGPHLNSYLSCLALRTAVVTTARVLNTDEDKLALNLSHLKVPRKHLCALEFPIWSPSEFFTLIVHLWSFNSNILFCSMSDKHIFSYLGSPVIWTV